MTTSVSKPPPMYMISLPFSDWPEPTLGRCDCPAAPETKKADVAEHPEAFDHVGLLVNKPPGRARLLFT
jgi:hypothetical protein